MSDRPRARRVSRPSDEIVFEAVDLARRIEHGEKDARSRERRLANGLLVVYAEAEALNWELAEATRRGAELEEYIELLKQEMPYEAQVRVNEVRRLHKGIEPRLKTGSSR